MSSAASAAEKGQADLPQVRHFGGCAEVLRHPLGKLGRFGGGQLHRMLRILGEDVVDLGGIGDELRHLRRIGRARSACGSPVQLIAPPAYRQQRRRGRKRPEPAPARRRQAARQPVDQGHGVGIGGLPRGLRHRRGEPPLRPGEGLDPPGRAGIGGEPSLDLQPLRLAELPVDEGLELALGLGQPISVVAHGLLRTTRSAGASPASRLRRSASRPRASRDISVPTGMPRIAAAST